MKKTLIKSIKKSKKEFKKFSKKRKIDKNKQNEIEKAFDDMIEIIKSTSVEEIERELKIAKRINKNMEELSEIYNSVSLL